MQTRMSLHIDTSKHRLSFKDFPMPEHYPSFPHHSEIKSYLDDYADAFGLLADIEFGNGVAHAAREEHGGWRILDQAGTERRFDLLVVGNGHHWDPRLPEFPGSFTGESIHSHHYIDPTAPLELSGKRVLVVGIGNSAADITVELSSKALAITSPCRPGRAHGSCPKYIAGRPGDMFLQHVAPPAAVMAAQGGSVGGADAGNRPDDVRPAAGEPQTVRGSSRPSRSNSHCGSGPAM